MCEDGGEPQDIDENGPPEGFTVTDNDDEDSPDGPNPGDEGDDNVPVFDDEPSTIPPTGSPDQPYSVTIKTPDNTEDTPMEIDTPTVDNVDKIVVIVDDQVVDEVRKSHSIYTCKACM